MPQDETNNCNAIVDRAALIAQELADEREERAEMYAVPGHPSTEDQLDYVRQLIKNGWLTKDDFKTTREYFRKKTMTAHRADELIKRGKARREAQQRNLIYP